MRIILSRKGFDSGSGGYPSPTFPDGSMVSMPIPYERSPVRYSDLRWRGRDLGELVERLTRGKVLRTDWAHLDPDLRPEMRPRGAGWRPALGQLKSAQGHLARNGVCAGDLFLFWGLFRRFDDERGWVGPRQHVIWGWLQIAEVVPVDRKLRTALANGDWQWAADHPHAEFDPDPTNTLYVAAGELQLLDGLGRGLPGAGVFDFDSPGRQLTAAGASAPGTWSLPLWFLPGQRRPLTYHANPLRWTVDGERVLLRAASRGQEFVLDAAEYPDATAWAAGLLESRGTG